MDLALQQKLSNRREITLHKSQAHQPQKSPISEEGIGVPGDQTLVVD